MDEADEFHRTELHTLEIEQQLDRLEQFFWPMLKQTKYP